MLVLVVGPSGAGKDTLIAAARQALREDGRFVFPRRVVTRTAVEALEDHESVSAEDFARHSAAGAYALSWQAHGLSYGLPARIADEVAAGRIVVVNGSRAMIGAARQRFAGTRVIMVEARAEVRARRLAGRGRESEAEIAARLAREFPGIPEGADHIDNSGELAQGIARFIETIERIAAM